MIAKFISSTVIWPFKAIKLDIRSWQAALSCVSSSPLVFVDLGSRWCRNLDLVVISITNFLRFIELQYFQKFTFQCVPRPNLLSFRIHSKVENPSLTQLVLYSRFLNKWINNHGFLVFLSLSTYCWWSLPCLLVTLVSCLSGSTMASSFTGISGFSFLVNRVWITFLAHVHND